MRQAIAILATVALLIVSSVTTQLLVIVIAAAAGILFLRNITSPDDVSHIQISYGPRVGGILLLVFTALLFGLPLLVTASAEFSSVAEAFYRAGALVFGGGHVVMPLLQDSLVTTGWVTEDQFLAGYGASQAIPGPMFAFSAYLGWVLSQGENAWFLATTALCFIFLPGFLLVVGVLPFWRAVAHNIYASRAIAGANAAVVGLLGAALYNPIITSGITNITDLAIAMVAFGMLAIWRVSPVFVVIWCILASVFA